MSRVCRTLIAAGAAALAALLSLTPSAPARAQYRLECPGRDVDRTIRDCSAVIGSHAAGAASAYAARCIALWLKGAFARAEADCEEALRRGADAAAGYLISGIAAADRGDHRAAIAHYTRSLERAETTSARYNRGTAYLALGEHDHARADLDAAIAGQPPIPQAHVNRALALIASGRSAAALADLDRAAELLGEGAAPSAVSKQVGESMGRQRGSTPAALALALRPYPPSRVLPESISLESLAHGLAPVPAVTVPIPGPTPFPQAAATAPTAPAHGRALAPGRSPPARDSVADCVRLWSPQTGTAPQQWRDMCRRLAF